MLFQSAAVKPGVKYRDVGAVIQKHAQTHGFSVVRSYCGHGIHQLFHTAPNIPHYASTFSFMSIFTLITIAWESHQFCHIFAENKAVGVMKPGHCFTIEPMISEGK